MATSAEAVRIPRRRLSIGDTIGLGIVGLIILWLIWNFSSGPQQFVQVAVIGVSNGALYALVALGYTLVYGIIELINFAHGDLFMLGGVFSATLLSNWLGYQHSSPGAWATAMLLVLPATMAFCCILNVVIERLAYRRLRNAGKLAPLITAVGVSFILQNIGLVWNGSAPQSRPTILGNGSLNIGSISIGYPYIWTILVTVVLLLIMRYIVVKTRQGKAMRATAQDPDAARLMGIDVNRTIAFVFGLGGAMAGAAAIMYVQANGETRYDAGFEFGLIAFTAAVLGGIGNLAGAVLGGLLIGVIQAANDGLPHGLGQEWSQSVVFTVLIGLMVFRPSGLLGAQVVDKV